MRNILIVDDEPGICETLGDILENKGYHVSKARCGEEALVNAAQEKFDLALVDVLMPGIDGLETCRRLKEIDQNIRVLLMTAYALNGTVARALQLGVDGVLYKPFDPEIICTKILNVDILDTYEGFLSNIWEKVKPIIGVDNLLKVCRDLISRNISQGKKIFNLLEVNADGISFSRLKKELGENRTKDLKEDLRAFIAQFFLILGKEHQAEYSDELSRKLGENKQKKE